jgi:hypothetical protein
MEVIAQHPAKAGIIPKSTQGSGDWRTHMDPSLPLKRPDRASLPYLDRCLAGRKIRYRGCAAFCD